MSALSYFHFSKMLLANMFVACLIWMPAAGATYWALYSLTDGGIGFALGLQHWVPYWTKLYPAASACGVENFANLAQAMWVLAALVPPLLAVASCSFEIEYVDHLKRAAERSFRIDRSSPAYRRVIFFLAITMAAILWISLSGAYLDKVVGLPCDELIARLDREVASTFVVHCMFWASIGESLKLLFLGRYISRYY